MKKMILATRGKVFTMRTLDKLVAHTRLREFATKRAGDETDARTLASSSSLPDC